MFLSFAASSSYSCNSLVGGFGALPYDATDCDGRDERPVPGLENVRHSRYFDLTTRGAYFLRDAAPPGTIVFYDFATHRMTPLLDLGDRFLRGMPSLSVTFDDSWMLYSEVDASGSNILMLENLR